MPFIKTITDEERLLAKRRIDEITGCWNWTGYVKKPTRTKKDYLPYGYIHIGSRTDKTLRTRQVHRVAASLWMGLNLADSKTHVLHKCDNPKCFNPDHLFFGNNDINVADRHAKKRENPPLGEKHYAAKLTELSVKEIRAAEGTHREIASRYNVDRSVVTAIKARKIWRHVA